MRAARVSALTERIDERIARDRLLDNHDHQYRRIRQCEEAGEFGAVFTDETDGSTRSYASLIPGVVESQKQQDREGPDLAFHARIRSRLAERFGQLEQVTREQMAALQLSDPLTLRLSVAAKRYQRLADKLANARPRGPTGYSLAAKKLITFWEDKAGLPRYCPDDSRDEAMRLSRRYLPPILEWQQAGYAVYYAVLTTRNRPPGELKEMQREQFKRLRQLIKATYPDGSLKFPEVKGYLAVQESPLGETGDWHAHLNVILVVEGRLEYEKLRRWWHWNLHIELLPQGEAALGKALRELIKYSVAAVSAKSEQEAVSDGVRERAARAQDSSASNAEAASPGSLGGSVSALFRDRDEISVLPRNDDTRTSGPPSCAEQAVATSSGLLREAGVRDRREWQPRGSKAPGMLSWPLERLAEWDSAQLSHRRTRTYGCLYGVKKPPREDLGQIVWVGWRSFRGGRYVYDLSLVRSIPEDKSHPTSGPLERYLRLRQRLATGWPSPGYVLPRLSEHT